MTLGKPSMCWCWALRIQLTDCQNHTVLCLNLTKTRQICIHVFLHCGNKVMQVNAPGLFIVDTVRPSPASGWCLRQMALETDAISRALPPFESNHWCSLWPVYVCACVTESIHVCEREVQLSMCVCVSYINSSSRVKKTKNCLSHWHGGVCLFNCLYICMFVCVCVQD